MNLLIVTIVLWDINFRLLVCTPSRVRTARLSIACIDVEIVQVVHCRTNALEAGQLNVQFIVINMNLYVRKWTGV